MSDGSYVQVLNEMYPGKVSWVSDDHSAMTTSTSGVWESKWGPYVLCQHAWDNTPYTTTSVKYYVSTWVYGSTDVLCNSSEREFTVISIPNASYSWNVGSGLSKSENGNSCTVTSNSSYTGLTYIEVEITSPIGGGQNDYKTSPRRYFWVGLGLDYITGPEDAPVDYEHSYYLHPERDYRAEASYSWYVEPSDGVTIDPFYEGAGITFTIPDMYRVTVEATNTCGTTDNTYLDVYVYDWPKFILSPNPASEAVTISVEESSVNKIDVNLLYSISIFNLYGVLQSNYTRSGTSFTLPITNLLDGNYIVRINDGKQIISKQLIVKH
jgi:hypothetical protein